jgi:hypothetical protein
MKLQLSPSFPKLLLPILLILAAVVPSGANFAVDSVLFYPFAHFLGFEPFVYRDKPFFATTVGGCVAAVVWSLLIYLLSSIRRVKKM